MLAYKCPVCWSSDMNQYLTCNHPACPDGRDQGPTRRTFHYDEAQAEVTNGWHRGEPERTRFRAGVGALILYAIGVTLWLVVLIAATRCEEAPTFNVEEALKHYNCEWVKKQLQTMTPEQLEAEARKWHVPEELIQLGKQCPR